MTAEYGGPPPAHATAHSDGIKARLLASRGLGTRTVEVSGVGPVTVRGLTRAEVLSMKGQGGVDPAAMERTLLASALVDPAMTEDEVGQWQAVSPAGELEPVSRAVQELSGLQVRAVGEEMARFQQG